MKKSLIALAVMAAAGAASAQSSVTLFGIVDATMQWSKSSGGDGIAPVAGASGLLTSAGPGDVRFRVTHSGYNSSRIGFRGTEDLGGGMAASFWLEAGLNNDDGSMGTTVVNSGAGAATGGGGLTFNRRSTVSLSGGWGEVRIGRDYTPSFWNLTVFDPFGTNGAGTTATLQAGFTGVNTIRASNSIGYFLPARLGGFYGQIQYAENELPNTAGNPDNGTYLGGRLGYASGPFNVALAYGRTDLGTDGKITALNLGGQWDFGMARLLGQVTRDENDLFAADGTGWLIGALVPVGAGEIRVAYSQYEIDAGGGLDPRQRKLALGYVHNLSKRTAVYTTLAHVRSNDGIVVVAPGSSATAAPIVTSFGTSANGGAAARLNGRSNVLDVGIRHSF